MTPQDYEKCLLALVMWREARGEGSPGMVAVGCVIRNRVKAGWYRGSWTENITHRNEFTSMSVLGDPGTVAYFMGGSESGRAAMSIADSLYSGTQPDVTNGALFYENPAIATSKWFIDNVRNKRPKVAEIGQHVFYS
jgi:N-acetylmuramoyl-L-alanine amidase